MDLYANAQIEKLKGLVESNGIKVPSLRGYRLMKDETPYAQDEYDKGLRELIATEWWLAAERDPEYRFHSIDEFINGLRPKHIPKGYLSERTGRRPHTVSFFQQLEETKARWKRQVCLWNRYAGQEEVLYIHSRMGWGLYNGNYRTDDDECQECKDWDVTKEPWFLDWCCDAADPTYVDIYATIGFQKDLLTKWKKPQAHYEGE